MVSVFAGRNFKCIATGDTFIVHCTLLIVNFNYTQKPLDCQWSPDYSKRFRTDFL